MMKKILLHLIVVLAVFVPAQTSAADLFVFYYSPDTLKYIIQTDAYEGRGIVNACVMNARHGELFRIRLAWENLNIDLFGEANTHGQFCKVVEITPSETGQQKQAYIQFLTPGKQKSSVIPFGQ